MKTAILAAALFATTLLPGQAQEEKPKGPPKAQKIVQLKYIDPAAMQEVLSVFGCCVRANPALKVVTLDLPQDAMQAAEDAIKRFDVPSAAPKDLELIAYFLVGSENAEPNATPVPTDLEPVVKQIRSIFALKNFSLLDTLLIRAGSGQGGQATGQATLYPGAKGPTLFRIRRWAARPGDKGEIIGIESLQTRFSIGEGVGVQLDRIDVPVGQKVVIGKSSMDGPTKTLVIVLSARLL
jgi:hypothetical protein